MLVLFLLASLFLSVINVCDARASLSSVVHEKRQSLPPGWSRSSRYQNLTAPFQLHIALAQRSISKLEEYLSDVSHPDSPNYGKHWSARRLAHTFAASNETVLAVQSWLASSGVPKGAIRLSKARTWIHVNASVAEVERLLDTQYHVFVHEAGRVHVASDQYSIPLDLVPHIDLITPTIHFDRVLQPQTKPITQLGDRPAPKTTKLSEPVVTNSLKHCNEQITPACLRALYNIHYQPMFGDKNSLGIVQYTPQSYSQADFDLFASNFSANMVGRSPKIVSIDGGELLSGSNVTFDLSVEANLDLQYSMSLVGPNQRVTLYQVGDKKQGASFNNFLDALDGAFCQFAGGDDAFYDAIYPDPDPSGYHRRDCGSAEAANVISTSYGYNEADLSPAYTARQCAEYGKLGLMGVTVIFSSGDYGVAGNSDYCLTSFGDQSRDGHIFNPSFPGSCPWVTTVGATQIDEGKAVSDPESACERAIYSGGGFSNHFAMPAYQKDAVHGYLEQHRPRFDSGRWNSGGDSRAYPDISANGADYTIAVKGDFYSVYGTSASAPVIASIVALVNDMRIGMNKAPVGFINPAIYASQFKGAFNDITEGNNPGCGTEGFAAASGWDPVTGMGTPNFPALASRWLSLL